MERTNESSLHFPKTSVRREFFKNAVSGALQLILNALLVLVTIPIFIKMLGTEGYGVFSLLTVVGNLSVLSSLGLNSSLIKFISQQGRTQESNYDIIVSFLILLGMVTIVLIAGLAFAIPILTNVLNIPRQLIEDVRMLYYLLLISNSFLLLGQVFSAVLDAVEKIYLTNIIQFIYNVVYWVLILGSLLIKPDYTLLGCATLVSATLWFGIVMSLAWKTWGTISTTGLITHFRRIVKKQLGYGLQIYTAGLVGFFYEPLTKILLSHFIGIAEVGFFDIALRIRNQLWGVVGKIFYPLFPLLAKTADRNKLRLLVHDIEQKTFLVIIPLAAMVVFTTTPVIQIWLGQNVATISLTVIFLLSAYLLFSTTVLPNYQYLMLKNQASKAILLQCSNATVNAFVFLLTYPHLGYYAAVAGGVAAIISSFVLSLYYQKKYLDSMIFDSINEFIKVVFLLIGCFATGFAVHAIVPSQWMKIVLVPATIAIASVVMYRLLNVFTPQDIQRYVGTDNMIVVWGTKVLCR